MPPVILSIMVAALTATLAFAATGATQERLSDNQDRSGSVGLCLYELPRDTSGRKRWINLAAVQYVETTRDELKIVFGGGNLGNGYEARFPLPRPEDAAGMLQKMMDRARACY